MIVDFEALRIIDVPRVGGKNAGLGELRHALEGQPASVPGGFAVTADGYRAFLEHNDLRGTIARHLEGLDATDVTALQQAGHAVREAMLAAEMPPALDAAIREALSRHGEGPVAVRSSATAEDLPEASFAGQQETFLGVEGADAIVAAVQKCFASLFTDRAISYRTRHGFGHLDVALSVGVQRMIDAAISGVMFTLDPDTGVRQIVHIDAVRGLGDALVSGRANADQYKVFSPLAHEAAPILDRRPNHDGASFVLDEEQVLRLARVGMQIQEHFGAPMDIEWAYDHHGNLRILQARPETVHARRSAPGLATVEVDSHGELLATGIAVGRGVGTGPTRIVDGREDLPSFREGEVLVAHRTDPDWEPAMRKAAAVITETGGRTCHAAIVCRELGVPAIVGVSEATTRLPPATTVTVSCAEGYEGFVYEGEATWHQVELDTSTEEEPPTRLMVNVANPFEAWRAALLPVDGVGLMRVEFVVGSVIGIHPLALVKADDLPTDEREQIALRTRAWPDPPAYFVDRLAGGIGQVAAAFWPRPVIVRLSDFKSNEYKALLGGSTFESDEANPMLGWRGASRYTDPAFRSAFELECQALRRVRETMGFTNVKIMVPFCRTIHEADAVLNTLEKHALRRGEHGLEVYVMVEIPSNALLAGDFAQRFDGFSIGSNDLTQLTLGVDRDADHLASVFDEGDEAVKTLIRLAIRGGHEAGIPVGICGQAPSDRPHFARWLVAEGIDSISLAPDSVIATRQQLTSPGYFVGPRSRE